MRGLFRWSLRGLVLWVLFLQFAGLTAIRALGDPWVRAPDLPGWAAGIHNDGPGLITVDDEYLRFWDDDTGASRGAIHCTDQMSLIYPPVIRRGERVVIGDHFGPARLWNCETGREVSMQHENYEYVMAALSPDGRRVLGIGRDGDEWVALLNSAIDGRLLAAVGDSEPGRYGLYYSLYRLNSFSADSSRCLVAGARSTGEKRRVFRVLDAEDGRELFRWEDRVSREFCHALSPSGRRVLIGPFADGRARQWSVDDRRELPAVGRAGDFTEEVQYLGEGRILTREIEGITEIYDEREQSRPRAFRVWDADTGRMLAELRGLGAGSGFGEVTPDNRWLIVRLSGEKVGLFEAATLKRKLVLPGLGISVSPDGERLAVSRVGGGIAIHALPSGALLATLPAAHAMGFSRNGRRLYTVSPALFSPAMIWERRREETWRGVVFHPYAAGALAMLVLLAAFRLRDRRRARRNAAGPGY